MFPPTTGSFSKITTLSAPASLAESAAVKPAPPDPTTTTFFKEYARWLFDFSSFINDKVGVSDVIASPTLPDFLP
nr:hypothetical protein [Dolosicoccus paucivorans]